MSCSRIRQNSEPAPKSHDFGDKNLPHAAPREALATLSPLQIAGNSEAGLLFARMSRRSPTIICPAPPFELCSATRLLSAIKAATDPACGTVLNN